MAPIKFEDKIKETLEQRTIEPSANSWSKLSERLDKDASSKNPRLFWWLGIAAGTIILLAIAIQFFGSNTTKEVMPQMVEGQKVKEKIDETNTITPTPIEQQELVEASAVSELPEEKKHGQSRETRPLKKKNKTTSLGNTKVASLDQPLKGKQQNPKEDTKENKGLIKEQSILEETAVAEVLKDVNETTKENNLEKEVDSLLKLASKELFKNKLKDESTKTVDAKALLESVQEDMGQSFRTRVFEALKDSYVTVRTAVAERNN
ncbi:hypothetical protein [uncultured Winogradskyella sp.]|uniref:hypothetical protein n=1 Tax=uncultured Winogradskyella sp. TaxID=395353 RepID=UPI0035180CE1